jgi:hypothetical protein
MNIAISLIVRWNSKQNNIFTNHIVHKVQYYKSSVKYDEIRI